MKKATILLSDLAFPEGLRWRDERLWFSDMFGSCSLNTIGADGTVQRVAVVPNHPSGLGFDLDGRPLIVSMDDCQLLRVADSSGTLETVCDFSSMAVRGNDMAVATDGTAYIGDIGFMFGEQDPVQSIILKVTPEGAATVVADGVALPNGMLITPDGKTLIVAETFAGRVSQFAIDANGDLGDRETFCAFDDIGWDADMEALMQRPVAPDGITLDANGSVWVANPLKPVIDCVNSDGDVVDSVELSQAGIDCALGGPDGRTLFIGTGSIADQEGTVGKIETCEVDVAGA